MERRMRVANIVDEVIDRVKDLDLTDTDRLLSLDEGLAPLIGEGDRLMSDRKTLGDSRDIFETARQGYLVILSALSVALLDFETSSGPGVGKMVLAAMLLGKYVEVVEGLTNLVDKLDLLIRLFDEIEGDDPTP